LEQLTSLGEDVKATLKRVLGDQLKLVIKDDGAAVQEKVQAMTVCNQGLLASQDFIDVFEPALGAWTQGLAEPSDSDDQAHPVQAAITLKELKLEKILQQLRQLED